MKLLSIAIGVAALTLLAGCIPSVYPLYTKETMVFEPKIIGEWYEEGTDNVWKFSQVDEFVYELLYTEHGEGSSFEVYAVKLDKFLFMDLFPAELNFKNELYKGSFLPMHHFARVDFSGDTLFLHMPDMDYFKKQIAEGKASVAHEVVNDGLMLTAKPEELQKFVLKYAAEDKAFSVESTLLRKK